MLLPDLGRRLEEVVAAAAASWRRDGAPAVRSWWSGPDFYVVVDGYDLVASPSGNPLAPLAELLAQGRDLGLHLVLARRASGMTRAGMEPVLNRLRELHTPGLLLSGDPNEGPSWASTAPGPSPPGAACSSAGSSAP